MLENETTVLWGEGEKPFKAWSHPYNAGGVVPGVQGCVAVRWGSR